MRSISFLVALLPALAALAACDREVPAADVGQRLFKDHKISTSPVNQFSCAMCHAVEVGQPAVIPGRLDSGYNLANAAGRTGFWGGYETTLLAAINTCLDRFMGGRVLKADEPDARALYDFLLANSPALSSPPLPFTVVRMVKSLAEITGDAGRGAIIWKGACYRCHGEIHTGEGRASGRASLVPEASIIAFKDQAREAVVEKVRHGRFFDLAGTMPLYSVEALSDEQLADMLAYLGL
jgi:thiosulfate dehydrogenase